MDIMEHDTITLARHATAPERRATAHETAADREPGDGAASQPDPGHEPELERLGNQIAELSARIDAANYELLLVLLLCWRTERPVAAQSGAVRPRASLCAGS